MIFFKYVLIRPILFIYLRLFLLNTHSPNTQYPPPHPTVYMPSSNEILTIVSLIHILYFYSVNHHSISIMFGSHFIIFVECIMYVLSPASHCIVI